MGAVLKTNRGKTKNNNSYKVLAGGGVQGSQFLSGWGGTVSVDFKTLF